MHKHFVVKKAKIEAAVWWLTRKDHIYSGVQLGEDMISGLPVKGKMPGLRQKEEETGGQSWNGTRTLSRMVLLGITKRRTGAS